MPTLEEDADPFISQRPNDGVVFFALVRVVLHIIARPLAVGDGEAAKLVKGLPVKLGTTSLTFASLLLIYQMLVCEPLHPISIFFSFPKDL